MGITCRYYDSVGSGKPGCLRTSVCRYADREQIDKFFTRETILGFGVRGNAVAVMRELEATGWFLAYISGRPKNFRDNTEQWLAQNGFPRGLVVCSGTPDKKFMAVNYLVSKLMPSKIICFEDDMLTRERYTEMYGAVSEFERITP
jgi:hypothetical protein